MFKTPSITRILIFCHAALLYTAIERDGTDLNVIEQHFIRIFFRFTVYKSQPDRIYNMLRCTVHHNREYEFP